MNTTLLRKKTGLGGSWDYIVDPYDIGEARGIPADNPPWYKDDHRPVEACWADAPSCRIPETYMAAVPELRYYEGPVWFRKCFQAKKRKGSRYLLDFQAVNYRADVWLNGQKAGTHEGGFTPFQFDVTDLLETKNSLIVRVDSIRHKDRLPEAMSDWTNFAGINRPVSLIEVPGVFISDLLLRYKVKKRLNNGKEKGTLRVEVRLDGKKPPGKFSVEIPQLRISEEGTIRKSGKGILNIPVEVVPWAPDNPKRYRIIVSCGRDQVTEQFGCRTVEVEDAQLLINGEPQTVRGICMHEEPIGREGRTLTQRDAEDYLKVARDLNVNFLRLAHYPHNAHMARLADRYGIMLWEEIPVYWRVDFKNLQTLAKAKEMMRDLITRDHNRASVVMWSVANETPNQPDRLRFLKDLSSFTKKTDPTRTVTAALLSKREGFVVTVDDPLVNFVDVIGLNEYFGWYTGKPGELKKVELRVPQDKPTIISECGAGALCGFHGSSGKRWTEEYQAAVYKGQLKVIYNSPGVIGATPWILKDFRTPLRMNMKFQKEWNRKGIIDPDGKQKLAYSVLKDHYAKLAGRENGSGKA